MTTVNPPMSTTTTDWRAELQRLVEAYDNSKRWPYHEDALSDAVEVARAALAQSEPQEPTGYQEIAKRAIESCLAQREEVLSAFIAKHGFHPEDAVQVEQRQPDGTSTWMIKRRSTQSEPQEPTHEELQHFLRNQDRARLEQESPFGAPDYDGSQARAARVADIRAALARWGRPAIEPVPVSERPPGPEDVNDDGEVWVEEPAYDYPLADTGDYDTEPGRWVLRSLSSLDKRNNRRWLPYHALPLPIK
jgi:hypothetical protein